MLNVFEAKDVICKKCKKVFAEPFRTMWPVKFLFDNDKEEFWFGATKLILCTSCTNKLKKLIKDFLEGK